MTTTTTRGDIDEGVYRAIGNAWENDPAYRALFESDPRRALAGKGLELPAGVDVRVRANSAETMHFVLPPDPHAVRGTRPSPRCMAACALRRRAASAARARWAAPRVASAAPER